MDFLASLIAAIARVEQRARMGGGRRLGKKKKPKVASGRPAKMGPSAGCGTGAGGFKAGNNCAKEDGIPQRPLSHGGALKGANAKDDLARAKALKEKAAAKKAAKEAADKAKSEATRPQREKQKKINKLRAEAAKRKAEKGERDVAEKQAAAEAAAKKRAAMLQKIRIKKANQQLQVVERPPSIFSGKATAETKASGETEVEFQIRRHKHDLDRLHAESDKIETEYAQKRLDAEKEFLAVKDGMSKHDRDSKMFNSDNAAWRKKREELLAEHDKAKARIEEVEKERDRKIHDTIGEFTRAYEGRTATVSLKAEDYSFEVKPAVSKEGVQQVKDGLRGSWEWLSGVASPKHEKTIARQKIVIRNGGGGSHDGKNEKLSIGAANGSHTKVTGVHEYAHAMENADVRTLKALDEDFTKRSNAYLSREGGKIMGIDGCDYYEGIYRPSERRSDMNLYDHSLLGYARRYSDCGYDEKTRKMYQSPRYNRGTEVYSTGVESLYREPAAFRKRARHGFDIAVLILSGRM